MSVNIFSKISILFLICFSLFCFQSFSEGSITEILEYYDSREINEKSSLHLDNNMLIFLARAKAQELKCLRQKSLLETYKSECRPNNFYDICKHWAIEMKHMGMEEEIKTSGLTPVKYIYVPSACF